MEKKQWKDLSLKQKIQTISVLIIICFVIFWICSPGTDSKQATGQKTSEGVKYKIGDLIKTDEFEIKISSATTRASVGEEYLREKAADGAVFLIVNFSYKNISKEPINSFGVPKVTVIDPRGTKYDDASGATSSYGMEINLNKKVLSDINPGITQKDATVFEISKDLWKTKGWKLLIDADKDIELDIK